MGKTILTPKQLDFLELVVAEPSVTKRFYFTGGTPLSEFYLKHRLSEDIDLFTIEEEVPFRVVRAFLKKISSRLLVKQIKENQFLGLFSYKLVYNDGDELKIDFNYYPFPRIERGIKYKNLEIDSVYDIATNKLHTMFMKPRTRDYVDLFFIMKKYSYPLEKLIIDAKTKFDWHIDKLNLASQFLRVKEIKDAEMPKMLVPFDRKEMEDFFLKEAKKLGKQILK